MHSAHRRPRAGRLFESVARSRAFKNGLYALVEGGSALNGGFCLRATNGPSCGVDGFGGVVSSGQKAPHRYVSLLAAASELATLGQKAV
jgi:hypothetical protein